MHDLARLGSDKFDMPIVRHGDEGHARARAQGRIGRLVRRRSNDDELPAWIGANQICAEALAVAGEFHGHLLPAGGQRLEHARDLTARAQQVTGIVA